MCKTYVDMLVDIQDSISTLLGFSTASWRFDRSATDDGDGAVIALAAPAALSQQAAALTRRHDSRLDASHGDDNAINSCGADAEAGAAAPGGPYETLQGWRRQGRYMSPGGRAYQAFERFDTPSAGGGTRPTPGMLLQQQAAGGRAGVQGL